MPLIQDIAAEVDQVFNSFGLTLNLKKGKTTAVLSFKGPGAPKARADFLLTPEPGCWVQSGNSRWWLHFSTRYQHLGTQFVNDGKIDAEVNFRIAQAHAAFAMIRKQVLCNRHLAIQTRLRLLDSLVLSKLFFGIGAWKPLAPKLQQKVEAAVMKMYRAVTGTAYNATTSLPNLTDAELLQRYKLYSPRLRITRDRLLYCGQLARAGPELTWEAVLLEHSVLKDNSWLGAVEADLAWLQRIVPDILPEGSTWSDWRTLWSQQDGSWNRLVKRACRLHHLQESTMSEVHLWHHRILTSLKKFGALFDGAEPFTTQEYVEYACPCGQAFSSPQGLAAHRRLKHGHHAPEFGYVDSPTCPICLRYFWTINRVRQHLAYIPRGGGGNPCFNELRRCGLLVNPEEVDRGGIPTALLGINRLEALSAAGPLPLHVSAVSRERQLLQQQLAEVDQSLAEAGYKYPPDAELAKLVYDQLAEITNRWFYDPLSDRESDSLQGAWLDCLAGFDSRIAEATFIFLAWGNTALEDLHVLWDYGHYQHIAEDAFTDVSADLHEGQLLQRQRKIQLRLDCLREEVHLPHRPVYTGPANETERTRARLALPSAYEGQEEWTQLWKGLRLRAQPSVREHVPLLIDFGKRPTFLILHLFAGRRRDGDFHFHLERLSRGLPFDIAVLSLDTANSIEYGNLQAGSRSWHRISTLCALGYVAGILSGAPCETFSGARHHVCPDSNRPGPRPLRSLKRLWGLPGLRCKELLQLAQGSAFSLQTLWSLAVSLPYGTLFASEHPAPPSEEERASIWRSEVVSILRQFYGVQLHHVMQYHWGSVTVKPTCLLTGHLPRFVNSMGVHKIPGAQRPTKVAIGKNEQGEFATAVTKEYPSGFSAGLAQAYVDRLSYLYREGMTVARATLYPDWLQAALEQTSTPASTTWLPDYQPDLS